MTTDSNDGPPDDGQSPDSETTPDNSGDNHRDDPRREIDYSPSSGAVDPDHAAQDQSEDMKTGRHSYTENATFIGGQLAAPSTRDVTWADDQSDGTRWTTLNEINRDFYASDEESVKGAQRQQNYRNDVQIWGQQIGLTDHEIRRATHLTAQTTPQERRKHSMDAIILAAITLAANEGRDDAATAPKAVRPQLQTDTDETSTLATAYTEIRDALGVSSQRISDARQCLRQYL